MALHSSVVTSLTVWNCDSKASDGSLPSSPLGHTRNLPICRFQGVLRPAYQPVEHKGEIRRIRPLFVVSAAKCQQGESSRGGAGTKRLSCVSYSGLRASL